MSYFYTLTEDGTKWYSVNTYSTPELARKMVLKEINSIQEDPMWYFQPKLKDWEEVDGALQVMHFDTIVRICSTEKEPFLG